MRYPSLAEQSDDQALDRDRCTEASVQPEMVADVENGVRVLQGMLCRFWSNLGHASNRRGFSNYS